MRLSASAFLLIGYSSLAFAGYDHGRAEATTPSSTLVSKYGRSCNKRPKSALPSQNSVHSAAYDDWTADPVPLKSSASLKFGEAGYRPSTAKAGYASAAGYSRIEIDGTMSYGYSKSYGFAYTVSAPSPSATLSETKSSPHEVHPSWSKDSTGAKSSSSAITTKTSSADTKSSSSSKHSWSKTSSESSSSSTTSTTSSSSASSTSSAVSSSESSTITSSSITSSSSTSSAAPSSSSVSCPTCPSGSLCISGSCVDVCDITYSGQGSGSGNAVLTPEVATARECCLLCRSTLDCVASAFTAINQCQLLVKSQPLEGAPITAMCPLGVENYTFLPGPGTAFIGPCAAAFPA